MCLCVGGLVITWKKEGKQLQRTDAATKKDNYPQPLNLGRDEFKVVPPILVSLYNLQMLKYNFDSVAWSVIEMYFSVL